MKQSSTELHINLEHFILEKIGELPHELREYTQLGSFKLFNFDTADETPQLSHEESKKFQENLKIQEYEENVTSDSSFEVSYTMPEVTIENVDFTTILPPQLNDVKRKE